MPGSRRYRIQHTSRYFYSSPVSNSAMTLCFKPREGEGQSLLSFEIIADPSVQLTHEPDYFGNTKHFLIIHQQHDSLEISALSTVEVASEKTLPDSLALEAWGEIEGWGESVEDWAFTHPSRFARPSAELDDFISRHGLESPQGDPLNALKHLSTTLYESFEYLPGSTSAVSPIEHILESGKGVCQDYVHVMISIARLWGVPSRYASGYLYVEDDTGQPIPAAAGHAWVECRFPEIGWVGFDPTNNWITGEQHVQVAVGRDYHDVAPTRGVFRGGGETRLEVEVRMEELGGSF